MYIIQCHVIYTMLFLTFKCHSYIFKPAYFFFCIFLLLLNIDGTFFGTMIHIHFLKMWMEKFRCEIQVVIQITVGLSFSFYLLIISCRWFLLLFFFLANFVLLYGWMAQFSLNCLFRWKRNVCQTKFIVFVRVWGILLLARIIDAILLKKNFYAKNKLKKKKVKTVCGSNICTLWNVNGARISI